MKHKDFKRNLFVENDIPYGLPEGNYLIVNRVYYIWILPLWIRTKVFSTDGVIWIHNDIFGMGNDHNIDRAFK